METLRKEPANAETRGWATLWAPGCQSRGLHILHENALGFGLVALQRLLVQRWTAIEL